MDGFYKIRYTNKDAGVDVEIESSDKDFVDQKIDQLVMRQLNRVDYARAETPRHATEAADNLPVPEIQHGGKQETIVEVFKRLNPANGTEAACVAAYYMEDCLGMKTGFSSKDIRTLLEESGFKHSNFSQAIIGAKKQGYLMPGELGGGRFKLSRSGEEKIKELQ